MTYQRSIHPRALPVVFLNAVISMLAVLAVAERVFFDLGPNVELVTMVMILASFYLGSKYSFLFTFLVLAISDAIIGNTNIYLFTWTGFLIPALFSSKLIKHQSSTISNSLRGSLTGLGANVFFFLWTNFGVWALDFGMYSNDVTGLIHSYINGLPFLKYQLTSTIVFVPLGFFASSIALNKTKLSLIFNHNSKRNCVQGSMV